MTVGQALYLLYCNGLIHKFLNFIFRNTFLFRLVKKISFYLNRYLDIHNKLLEEKLQNRWEKLFINQNYLEFTLNKRVLIKLYKNSKISELIYNGFEIPERDYLSMVLVEGDYFVDIGANIGLFSLIAAEIVGEGGKVISFEPTSDSYERFIENISLNKFKNIDSYNIGLSNSVGSLTMNISTNGYDAWNTFAITTNSNLQSQMQVSVSTLDIQLTYYNKAKIKLVKIDVEGWEKFVLKGGVNFFTNYSPQVLVEFTEENTFAAGYMVQEIYDFMVDLGYDWYSFREKRLVKAEKKIHYPYENLLAIKKT